MNEEMSKNTILKNILREKYIHYTLLYYSLILLNHV